MAKRKYYVVIKGRKPGIYNTWTECKAQVDGYSNARYKSYKTYEEAKQAFENGKKEPPPRPKKRRVKKREKKPSEPKVDVSELRYSLMQNSLYVLTIWDERTTSGTYSIMLLPDKRVLFKSDILYNVSEQTLDYLGALMAINYVMYNQNDLPNKIFTRSGKSIELVKQMECDDKFNLSKHKNTGHEAVLEIFSLEYEICEMYEEILKAVELSLAPL